MSIEARCIILGRRKQSLTCFCPQATSVERSRAVCLSNLTKWLYIYFRHISTINKRVFFFCLLLTHLYLSHIIVKIIIMNTVGIYSSNERAVNALWLIYLQLKETYMVVKLGSLSPLSFITWTFE